MDLLLCALGAFFVVELIKAVWFRSLRPWSKLVIALVVSTVGAVLIDQRTGLDTRTATLAVAAAGLAVMIHRVCRMFRVTGDWLVKDIIRRR